MIHAIALDDEPPALEIIKTFCQRQNKIELHATFTSTIDASDYIEKHNVELLFLDINMPSVNGLQFYQSLSRQLMVIFTTSYSEFAVESYAINAIDYLLKPFTFNRFSNAIEKAINLYELKQIALQAGEQFLTVRVDYGLVKLPFADIEFIEGLDNYLKIHLKGQQPVVIRMTIKTLLEKLPSPAFLRVHRSYIVALKQIRSFRNRLITLYSEEEIPVGNNYESDFLKFFRP